MSTHHEDSSIFSRSTLGPTDLTTIALDDLVSFFTHPTRHLLRTRAGVSLSSAQMSADDIPIAPDGLATWSIGDRMLGLVLAGEDLGRVHDAERLRGTIPPGVLGAQLLDMVTDQVSLIRNRLPKEWLEPPEVHDIGVRVGDAILTGRLATRANMLIGADFSKLGSRHKLATWLRLVALAAADPGPWRSVWVAKDKTFCLRGPRPDEALAILTSIVEVFRTGMTRPLPLPPSIAEKYAKAALSGTTDARTFDVIDFCSFEWKRDRDASWDAFFPGETLFQQRRSGNDAWGSPDEPLELCALARLIWTPLMAHVEDA